MTFKGIKNIKNIKHFNKLEIEILTMFFKIRIKDEKNSKMVDLEKNDNKKNSENYLTINNNKNYLETENNEKVGSFINFNNP